MSSELPAVAAASPSEGAVLLRGHLHPAVLLLSLIGGLRSAAFPCLLGLVADRMFLILGGVLFLVQVGTGLVRYLTFHYVLTEDELRTREGVLHRQERRIPIDRIQDLGFESTILRRILGLTVVRVETASGQGVEAVLDSLGRGESENLREVLLRLRVRVARGVENAGVSPADGSFPPPPSAAPDPEWTIYRASPGMLLLRGLTDLRIGAVLVAAFGAYEVADRLGVLTQIRGVGATFYDWLRGFPIMLAAGMLLGLVFGVLALSVAFAAVGNLMAFHGFHLSLRADSLLCRFGLLTTRQKTLPRQRVQRVRVEQTWLRRLLGVAVARADSAGSGRGTGEEAPGGFDVVIPLAELAGIEALLPAVLPGLEQSSTQVSRASRMLVWRVFLRSCMDIAVLIAVLLPFAHEAAWFGLLLVPFAWLLGRLYWQGLAYGLWQHHVYLRWGVLGSYQVLLPTAKVQAVALMRGPLQRLLGLSELRIFVAGGPPTRIPDLAKAEAEALLAALSARATIAAADEWNERRVGFHPGPA
jgi:putative membrane protein